MHKGKRIRSSHLFNCKNGSPELIEKAIMLAFLEIEQIAMEEKAKVYL